MNSEFDSERLGEIAQRASEVRRGLDDLKATLQKKFASMAGPLLPQLLHSSQEAERYLQDPDEKARCAALIVLTHYWQVKGNHADRCEQMASADPAAQVRAVAVACLGELYAQTNNKRIGRFFARLVRDESLALAVRSAAYTALHLIRGVPVLHWPSPVPEDLPNEVNWGFVETFE